MPKFCTSCGSPVQDDMKFCLNCGQAVGAGAPPTGGAARPAVPARSSSPGAAAASAPAKGGSPVMKIVLIVVGVVVLLTVLSMATCFYFAYKAKQRASALMETAKTMSTQGTPEVGLEGGEGSGAERVATVDVPPYPGSVATDAGGDLSFGGAAIASQQYETDDSVDKVLAFYKEKFGNRVRVQQAGGNAVLQLTTKNGLTTITVSREQGDEKTRISITRIGK